MDSQKRALQIHSLKVSSGWNGTTCGRYKTQVTGHRSGHRAQVTGHRAQVTGHRAQVTGHRAQVTGHRAQGTGHRAQKTQ